MSSQPEIIQESETPIQVPIQSPENAVSTINANLATFKKNLPYSCAPIIISIKGEMFFDSTYGLERADRYISRNVVPDAIIATIGDVRTRCWRDLEDLYRRLNPQMKLEMLGISRCLQREEKYNLHPFDQWVRSTNFIIAAIPGMDAKKWNELDPISRMVLIDYAENRLSITRQALVSEGGDLIHVPTSQVRTYLDAIYEANRVTSPRKALYRVGAGLYDASELMTRVAILVNASSPSDASDILCKPEQKKPRHRSKYLTDEPYIPGRHKLRDPNWSYHGTDDPDSRWRPE